MRIGLDAVPVREPVFEPNFLVASNSELPFVRRAETRAKTGLEDSRPSRESFHGSNLSFVVTFWILRIFRAPRASAPLPFDASECIVRPRLPPLPWRSLNRANSDLVLDWLPRPPRWRLDEHRRRGSRVGACPPPSTRALGGILLDGCGDLAGGLPTPL